MKPLYCRCIHHKNIRLAKDAHQSTHKSARLLRLGTKNHSQQYDLSCFLLCATSFQLNPTNHVQFLSCHWILQFVIWTQRLRITFPHKYGVFKISNQECFFADIFSRLRVFCSIHLIYVHV